MKQKKAVGLISGGLDSILALSIIQNQGFDIIAVYIKTPFLSDWGEKTAQNLKKLQEELHFDLRILESGNDYIDLLKNPVYGYGKNCNPCIDCHIYMIKKAKDILEKENAQFIFTGEVLGQRDKSQNFKALKTIAEKSTTGNNLLRPLSAKLLPETRPEKEKIVNRAGLQAIQGKRRDLQLYMAESKGLKYYQTPAGGCLLTDKQFCKRLKDLFAHKKNFNRTDLMLLQKGRHFRISENSKLIISRSSKESREIIKLKDKKHYVLIPENSYLTALIEGELSETALEIFASYMQGKTDTVRIRKNKENKIMTIEGKDKIEYHKYLL
jgi:tRNA-uridine 2-sulfurtransferase